MEPKTPNKKLGLQSGAELAASSPVLGWGGFGGEVFPKNNFREILVKVSARSTSGAKTDLEKLQIVLCLVNVDDYNPTCVSD